jgi:uncharacterized surface protein with fasciclin (FAS1) repeats
MTTIYRKLLRQFAVILAITGLSLLVTTPAKSGVPTTRGDIQVPTTPKAQAPAIILPSTTPKVATKDLTAVITSQKNLTILSKALKAAGLIETLQGIGPFTLFAPNDGAFAKIPPGGLQDLLKPENKEVLVKILTYHLVLGKITTNDLKSGFLNSFQGDPITVKNNSPVITVNDAHIIKADIPATNGVIHQIDTLILPPSL